MESLSPSNYSIIRWFGFDQFIPEQAFNSHWMSCRTFFMVRIILTLYSTITFWAYFVVMIDLGRFGGFFAAFTTLTFIGLHAYLVTACVYHFRYLRYKNVNFLLNQPTVLNYLYLYLYTTVMTFNVLTPVVFWSILNADQSTNSLVVEWLNVSVHGASFFLMFIDVLLNTMTIPIRLVLPVFFTLISYMLLAFIIYARDHTWVYPFLSWDQGPSAAIWYFLVATLVIVFFFFMVSVHLLRDWVAWKLGKFTKNQKYEINHDLV
ncbi:uncharacterized protein EV154DRAFT_576681 [Mucor mucedo]|uniref:uncharacterized protein n=1 Tax=Mucor mucedo TaxID=29922 RepID=UPI0022206E9E|nr:uncharacterized protein EV154DRAFT_576681 [Mucor mucedo]KAI7894855.1 hypothetical protein EV154DRAFT_576681 [Mucor mucedo]